MSHWRLCRESTIGQCPGWECTCSIVSCGLCFVFPTTNNSHRSVWVILVLELAIEVLIRPPNYGALMTTDKAFAPSTARHINRFHLVFEIIALALYIPQVSCSLSATCQDGLFRPFLDRARAPLWALTSLHDSEAVLGRLDLGLTFLRAFGLIRHWKQMWINYTFERDKSKRST